MWPLMRMKQCHKLLLKGLWIENMFHYSFILVHVHCICCFSVVFFVCDFWRIRNLCTVLLGAFVFFLVTFVENSHINGEYRVKILVIIMIMKAQPMSDVIVNFLSVAQWPHMASYNFVNPLHAKFFRWNLNIYLHLMSFLHTNKTQLVEIPPRVRQGPAYST